MSDVATLTARLELEDGDYKSQMEEDKSLAEDFKSTLEDITDRSLSIDTSGVTGPLQEAAQAASEYASKTSEITDVAFSVDSSGAVSGMQEVDSNAKTLEGDVASLHDMFSTLFTGLEVAAAIAALYEVQEAVSSLVESYGELEYASTAAALKAGPGMASQIAPSIRKISEELAVQTGGSSEDIATMMGTLLGYGYAPGAMTVETLQPFMNLSELPGVGPDTSANLIAIAEKNFNVTSQQAADMIATTLMSSNISAESLLGTMPKGSIAAKTGGMDLATLLSVYQAGNVQRGLDPSMMTQAMFLGAQKLSEPLDISTNAKGETVYKGIAKTLHDEGVDLDILANAIESIYS